MQKYVKLYSNKGSGGMRERVGEKESVRKMGWRESDKERQRDRGRKRIESER